MIFNRNPVKVGNSITTPSQDANGPFDLDVDDSVGTKLYSRMTDSVNELIESGWWTAFESPDSTVLEWERSTLLWHEGGGISSELPRQTTSHLAPTLLTSSELRTTFMPL